MYKTIQDVTIGSLKKHYTLIHYFGLGFIQIKLGPRYRIHFYTNLLPAIISEEEIHNHRYDFTLTILAGTFTQKIYQVTQDITHTMEDESCTEHNELDSGSDHYHKQTECGVTLLSEEHYVAGSSYTINANTFHTVQTTDAITFIDRKPYSKEFAQVIRPKDLNATCPFSKKIDENELWVIVENILAKHKT